MKLRFLSARWANLALVTYAMDPGVIAPHLPRGVVPDVRDGQAFASLVGFDFLDTRVLGIPWPGFQRFPEFNLRFYVRQGDRRGVVFFREIVPQRFVAWVARTLYGEPYYAAPIRNKRRQTAGGLEMTYQFDWEGRPQTLRVEAQGPPRFPEEGGTEDFFKEHRWGFGTTHFGEAPIAYEVVHPRWRTYDVSACHIDIDFAHVYGEKWDFLQGADPYSVVLAEGSGVEVYWRSPLG